MRFQIDVGFKPLSKIWEAKVYDFEDHGQDLPYATIISYSLEEVLRQASHYCLVAVS